MGSLLSLFLSTVAFATIAFTLFEWGSPTALISTALARAAVIAAAIICVLAVYLFWIVGIPPRWDAEKNARIDEFESRVKPQLMLVFGEERIFKDVDRFGIDCWRTRIKFGVKNLSSYGTAEDVNVVFANVVSKNGNYVADIGKLMIFEETEAPSININPGDTKYLKLCMTERTAYTNKTSDTYVTFGPFFKNYDIRAKGPGPYTLKIRVSGRDILARILRCKVSLDENGIGLCRPLDKLADSDSDEG